MDKKKLAPKCQCLSAQRPTQISIRDFIHHSYQPLGHYYIANLWDENNHSKSLYKTDKAHIYRQTEALKMIFRVVHISEEA